MDAKVAELAGAQGLGSGGEIRGVGVPLCASNVHEQSIDPDNSERCFFKMKPVTIIGIVLILLGVLGFALGGFSFTHEKKVVDMGPVQVSHQQTKTVPIPPILSAIALIGGIGLVVIGARSN